MHIGEKKKKKTLDEKQSTSLPCACFNSFWYSCLLMSSFGLKNEEEKENRRKENKV